ncbi:MAG: DinB family protein [Bryobacteraceae bacterium]
MSNNVLLRVLEDGRQDVVASVLNLPDELAAIKPGPEKWSVLECLEHIVAVEERFLGFLANGAVIVPTPSDDKEAQLSARVRDRSDRVQAPEAVVPTGRYTSVEEALTAFQRVRDLSVRVAQERGDALYGIGVKHGRFGDINGSELVHVLASHACRHAAQIRETRAALVK